MSASSSFGQESGISNHSGGNPNLITSLSTKEDLVAYVNVLLNRIDAIHQQYALSMNIQRDMNVELRILHQHFHNSTSTSGSLTVLNTPRLPSETTQSLQSTLTKEEDDAALKNVYLQLCQDLQFRKPDHVNSLQEIGEWMKEEVRIRMGDMKTCERQRNELSVEVERLKAALSEMSIEKQTLSSRLREMESSIQRLNVVKNQAEECKESLRRRVKKMEVKMREQTDSLQELESIIKAKEAEIQVRDDEINELKKRLMTQHRHPSAQHESLAPGDLDASQPIAPHHSISLPLLVTATMNQSGENLFRCSSCGDEFVTIDELHVHMGDCLEKWN